MKRGSRRIRTHTQRLPGEISLRGVGGKTMRGVIYIWQLLQRLEGSGREDGAGEGGIMHGKGFIFLRNGCVDWGCNRSDEGSLGRWEREAIGWVLSVEGCFTLSHFNPPLLGPIIIYAGWKKTPPLITLITHATIPQVHIRIYIGFKPFVKLGMVLESCCRMATWRESHTATRVVSAFPQTKTLRN